MDTRKIHQTPFRLIPIIVAVCALAFSGCSKSTEDLLADAQSQIAAKDHATAIVTLKNLLQQDPDNLAGRLALANSSLVMGDPLSAEKELARAAELGAQGGEFLSLHYRTQLTLGRHSNVLELLASDDGTTGLSDAEALQFRGEALLGLGSALQAQETFEEILATEPNNALASWGLAGALATLGDTTAAEAIASDLVAAHADFARGWLIKGQLALRAGRLEDAAKDLQVAVDKAAATPDRIMEVVALATLGDAQLGLQSIAAAEITIRRLASLSGPTPVTRLLIARLAIAQQDYTLAAGELEQLSNADPSNIQVNLLLASVQITQGNFSQAESLLQRVLAVQPENIAAIRLLAAAQVITDDPAAAAETLSPLLEDENLDPQLTMFASQALLQSGDSVRAIDLLEQSLASEPGNVDIRTRLAAAYLIAGRLDDTLATAESIPEDAGFKRGIILAFAYAAQGELDIADATVSKVITGYGDNASALILAADYMNRRGDSEQSRELLGKALAVDADNAVAKSALAGMEYGAGNRDTAKALFEEVLASDSENTRAMMMLANMSAGDGDLDRSIELLNSAIEIDPDSAMSRLMLAQALYRNGDLGQARQTAHQAVNQAPENARIVAGAGRVLLDAGQAREAQGYLRKATEQAPESAGYWFELARAQDVLGEKTEARKALEESVRLAPAAIRPTTALALMEVSDGYPERAFELVEQLKAAQPDSLAPRALEAEVLSRTGSEAEAAAMFAAIYAEQPSLEIAIKTYQTGTRAELPTAHEPLEDWSATHPDDAASAMILAQYHEQQGRVDEAIERYEAVIAVNADNAIALNNLAWIYNENGDARAEDLARRAHDLQPKSSSILDTLGWVLVSNGKSEEAVQMLEKAAELAPDSKATQYHLAVAASKAGDNARSVDILKQLLADSDPFAERSAAEDLLVELVE